MQLKAYQERTLSQIEEYAKLVRRRGSARIAFLELRDERYKPAPASLAEIPYVCIKIPTGGGKTLVASHAVGRVFTHYLQRDAGLVMWLVPWDNIQTQTLAALRDKKHPYRQVLDSAFPDGLKVVTLKEALFGALRPEDLQANLCVVVATLPAFRVEDTEGRKVYESNGYLMSHFANVLPEVEARLERDFDGLVIQSLANVIRLHAPMLVLDEGHNARTSLSYDTLARLNPSFMLEYTATPSANSNILVSVPAFDLKQEAMVKLPIWLSNRTDWRAALRDAKAKRDELEIDAKAEEKAGGDYVRPILLIQAEPRSSTDADRVTVDHVQDFLLGELKLPDGQVAVKTGEKDELEGINLFAATCPIRYIITVYALKEGWDCSFAYVLASAANLRGRQPVEQIIGRVLRLPFARRKVVESLNYAYVYTVSSHFHSAAEAVQEGLMGNGYAPEDARPAPTDQQPSVRVGRIVEDDIRVPMLAVLNGNNVWRRLGIGHLIGDFDLADQSPVIAWTAPDEERTETIDVRPDNDRLVIGAAQLTLPLAFRERAFAAPEMIHWLDQHLRNRRIGQSAKRAYFQHVIEHILADKGPEYLTELTHYRFSLLDRLSSQIEQNLDDHAHQRLLWYKGAGKLSSDGESPYVIPATIDLLDTHRGTFQKHLFKQAALMNDEECDFAEHLDALSNLRWWYRNRENVDFYLQGWWGKFYPDFLAQTNSGVFLALEYKGEHLATAEDAERKEELGKVWEDVSSGRCRFWMVTMENMDSLVAAVRSM